MIRNVRNSLLAAGTECIFAPGEIEWDCAGRQKRDGIPLESQVLTDLARTAEGLGISMPGDGPLLEVELTPSQNDNDCIRNSATLHSGYNHYRSAS
jgi:hypothetical protein